MKWLWQLFWDPIRAFDLEEPNGDANHGKLVGALALVIFAFLTVREPGWPPAVLAALFLSAAFGPRMFYRWLQRSNFSASETVIRTDPNYKVDDERGA